VIQATESDRNDQWQMDVMSADHRVAWLARTAIDQDRAAEHVKCFREAAVREALDAQARRVFAALCDECRSGRSAVRGANRAWRHPPVGGMLGGGCPCHAGIARDAAGPEGRLDVSG
jgi:hypothetical protein